MICQDCIRQVLICSKVNNLTSLTSHPDTGRDDLSHWLNTVPSLLDCNIIYYKVHPSEVDFNLRRSTDRLFVYLFGKRVSCLDTRINILMRRSGLGWYQVTNEGEQTTNLLGLIGLLGLRKKRKGWRRKMVRGFLDFELNIDIQIISKFTKKEIVSLVQSS